MDDINGFLKGLARSCAEFCKRVKVDRYEVPVDRVNISSLLITLGQMHRVKFEQRGNESMYRCILQFEGRWS